MRMLSVTVVMMCLGAVSENVEAKGQSKWRSQHFNQNALAWWGLSGSGLCINKRDMQGTVYVYSSLTNTHTPLHEDCRQRDTLLYRDERNTKSFLSHP